MGLLCKKYAPDYPDLSLQQVWTEFTSNPSSHKIQSIKTAHACLHKFSEKEQESILRELLEIEVQASRKSNSLLYLRKQIVHLIDRKMSAKMLINMDPDSQGKEHKEGEGNLSSQSIELVLSDCEIQIAVLREYIKGKYGDATKNDWFELYACISEYFHRNMMQKSQRQQNEKFTFDGQLLNTTEDNLKKCREICLKAYVGQQFKIKPEDGNWIKKFIHAFKSQDLWK
jgi:hypothetical protein